jgi:hypothetical protein
MLAQLEQQAASVVSTLLNQLGRQVSLEEVAAALEALVKSPLEQLIGQARAAAGAVL